MAMTLLERILAVHSNHDVVRPGEIVDIEIDARVARDFGGANVVKNMRDFSLGIDDPAKTFFTFDCNPTGSDQKYAVNQHICRQFAREKGIRIYDIDAGIGTHLLIDEGFVYPGATSVSTDSHANIIGAIGAFGQGMGDMDISAAWHEGKVWFKVPYSVKIFLDGDIPANVSSKDIVLNLLNNFGANSLLGFSIEMDGSAISNLSLDDRVTISSMATEMGAVIILFPPSDEIKAYCAGRTSSELSVLEADSDAVYLRTYRIDVSKFLPMISRPGEPHDTVDADSLYGIKIDSAFIGSCTNGRMSDMRMAASILKDRRVAPGVVLKIVPATDAIWRQCLDEGLIKIFKEAGALVSNAGCAGCAAGQVGQNGPGEITISSGNRNFPGKQGKGSVYLASPQIVASSAIAGFIATPDRIPSEPSLFATANKHEREVNLLAEKNKQERKAGILEGRVWIINKDNIDTDMIYHNRYLAITDMKEMGQYTFDNLAGFTDFAKKAERGDILIAGKNFGCGSSRQQAVDCFASLGIQAVIAESFGVIYERNAINAAFPVIASALVKDAELKDGDRIRINLVTGEILNLQTNNIVKALPFSDVQLNIYNRGGLLEK
jgi:3-isopropylmalate/(R)-2-methylmalate dehydratase large subunit